jgi:hypothetical protein
MPRSRSDISWTPTASGRTSVIKAWEPDSGGETVEMSAGSVGMPHTEDSIRRQTAEQECCMRVCYAVGSSSRRSRADHRVPPTRVEKAPDRIGCQVGTVHRGYVRNPLLGCEECVPCKGLLVRACLALYIEIVESRRDHRSGATLYQSASSAVLTQSQARLTTSPVSGSKVFPGGRGQMPPDPSS